MLFLPFRLTVSVLDHFLSLLLVALTPHSSPHEFHSILLRISCIYSHSIYQVTILPCHYTILVYHFTIDPCHFTISDHDTS
ncbi:hypothetical protein C8J56DRAFT_419130 [Mycena floridula]|nr:hypothetical protein C8J56DRAFT_419130 [Mycena floridula]